VAFIPQRDAGEFEWLSFEQSGVLTTPQAVRLVGRGVVRSHLRLGRWRRICRGILLTHNGEVNHDQQLWVAVLAAGPGALLAGAAAAAEGGVRHLRVPMLNVLIPAARGSTERIAGLPMDMPAVRVHRSRILPPEHHQVGRPPRTVIARSVVDAAVWARTPDEARTVLAAACQQRRVMPEEVRDVLAVLPSVRRRSLIRTTLADIEGGSQALSEIDFGRLCRRFHLPPPDRQERRKDASGRNRYLDAYWREWHLHVEVDGSHHMDVRHWAADMLRQNEVWIAGDRILRFPAWLIRTEPAQVADQLLVALRAAGWR
jgi:hypothetical protein